jgi:hypothetical protein
MVSHALDKAFTDRSGEARRELATPIETLDDLVLTAPPQK